MALAFQIGAGIIRIVAGRIVIAYDRQQGRTTSYVVRTHETFHRVRIATPGSDTQKARKKGGGLIKYELIRPPD